MFFLLEMNVSVKKKVKLMVDNCSYLSRIKGYIMTNVAGVQVYGDLF